MKSILLKISCVVAAVLFSAVLYGQQADQSGVIRVVGSDIAGPVIKSACEKSAKDASVKASYDLQGTYPAMPKLKNGEADLGIIAVPKGNTLPEGFMCIPILHHAAIVAVNGQNPVDEMSVKQLNGIFGKKAVRIEKWEEISKSMGHLRGIQPMTTNFTDNLVVEIFKNTALGGDDIGGWVSVLRDKKEAVNVLGTGASVILIVGKATDSQRVKVLPISAGKEAGDYAFKPSNETIHNGDYPLALTFYVMFKPEKADLVKPLVKAMLSDDTAASIDAGDFYSVPKNFRKRYVLELDTLK